MSLSLAIRLPPLSPKSLPPHPSFLFRAFVLGQAGALFAGLLMVGTPFAKKAQVSMQPLRSLFGCIYLGSLGMIINPVSGGTRDAKHERGAGLLEGACRPARGVQGGLAPSLPACQRALGV